jgi:hypothetical protein
LVVRGEAHALVGAGRAARSHLARHVCADSRDT